jgi:TPR repeat protein
MLAANGNMVFIHFKADVLNIIFRNQFDISNLEQKIKHPDALYGLSLCDKKGEGIARNHFAAVDCFHQAAELGHDDAETFYGRCSLKGRGVPKNAEEGVVFLT